MIEEGFEKLDFVNGSQNSNSVVSSGQQDFLRSSECCFGVSATFCVFSLVLHHDLRILMHDEFEQENLVYDHELSYLVGDSCHLFRAGIELNMQGGIHRYCLEDICLLIRTT